MSLLYKCDICGKTESSKPGDEPMLNGFVIARTTKRDPISDATEKTVFTSGHVCFVCDAATRAAITGILTAVMAARQNERELDEGKRQDVHDAGGVKWIDPSMVVLAASGSVRESAGIVPGGRA